MPVEKMKTEKCKVLAYNTYTKDLDINFRGYGIRLHNVNKKIEDYIYVKYRGEIGKPDFECKV